MLFPEEDVPYLKEWIVKRIEKTSDADSEVLAEYIIALLKHDGDKPSIRKLCEEEIPDFLNEDTVPFLDDVFEAITFKSYRPGAPPPPKRPHVAHAPPAALAPHTGPAHSNAPPSGPRKRGPEEMDIEEGEVEMQDEQPVMGRRTAKQARRQARRKARQEEMQQQQHGTFRMPIMFDPQDPMVMEAMTQMGMPFPHYPSFSGRGQQRRRGRCRDFDNKGYCSRGGTCPFDHGTEPTMPHNLGEYDPRDGVVMLNHPTGFPFFPPPGQDQSGGRGGRKNRGGKRGGARAPYSADGPVHDQSRSTIVIENIPEESFSEDAVRGFFSQFGNITEVSMQPYKHLAIVKYENWSAANAAYRSPKVIFDNRFVKVFWYKDSNDNIPTSQSNPEFDASKFAGDDVELEEGMDPEEFQRRQEEAQKQHEERESKRKELERQRLELQQKQQELIAKHREEVARLHERLAQENGNGDGESSSADKLRQKLLALEQEAKILGIDPDAPPEYEEHDYPTPYAPRGGYRGRGRGRGRGGMRGRGSFHGNEGRHAAYAQYSLDNRPRSLAIKGVDLSAPERDEQLRHFLLQLGEFESVKQVPSDDNGGSPATHVSFGDRKTAERFFVMLNGNELPGVKGKLELSWLSNPPNGNSAAVEKSTAADLQERKVEEEDGVGDAMAGNDSQRPEMEVEYGGGNDDDAW